VPTYVVIISISISAAQMQIQDTKQGQSETGIQHHLWLIVGRSSKQSSGCRSSMPGRARKCVSFIRDGINCAILCCSKKTNQVIRT
jgi:hypothetical protein